MQNSPSLLSDREKYHALPWSLACNVLSSFFVYWTFVGSIFPLFLSTLGLPKAQIGVLLSLFPFCGLLSLGFAPVAARWGRKRVFLLGYGIRSLVMALLLLLPWLLFHAGYTVAIIFLFAILIVFALLRAMAETAFYPWTLEYMPSTIRGKFTAANTVFSTIAACLALLIASYVIGKGEGLSPYLLLIAIGSALGLLGTAAMWPVQGGAPTQEGAAGAHRENMLTALHDRTFVGYLGGAGCVTLGMVLLTSFLPLYVKEQLGMPPGTVVALDMVTMLGGVASGLVWGWASDRVGSRRVLLPALGLCLLISLGWLLLPHALPHMVVWCGLLYLGYGIFACGIGIGTDRLLYTGIMPPEQKTAYTAIFYAWAGLTGGIAPLLAGRILTVCASRHAAIGCFALDGHAVLFLLSLLLLAGGLGLFVRVRPRE